MEPKIFHKGPLDAGAGGKCSAGLFILVAWVTYHHAVRPLQIVARQPLAHT